MASGTNATKRHKLDFSDPLLLIVGRGDAAQTFYFPRSLIARSACIRNLQKVHDKRLHFDAPIELPDVDPAVFSIYFGLLVQNTVVTPEVDLETAWCLLVKAYILSRRISDTQAANSIMKEIINRLLAFNGVPDDRALVPAINHVFDRTVESGNSIKLRRLFIDYTVCISGGGDVRSWTLL